MQPVAEKFSVFRLPSGKYKAVAQVRDRTGKLRPKQIQRKTEALARKAMTEWLAEHGRLIPARTMSTSACCEAYLARCEAKGRKERTVRDYARLHEVHIKPSIGHIPIGDLHADHVEAMLEKIPGDKEAVNTRAFLRAALNRIGKKADANISNAAAIAEPRSYTIGDRVSIDPELFAEVLAAEQVPWRRALWLLIASNGLRPTEGREITWLELTERKDGMWLELKDSKTPEGRKPVPVPNVAADELRALRKSSIYVFPNANGIPYNETTICGYWREATNAAGIAPATIYALRHMFGTIHAKKSKDHILKRLMRHKDVRTTKQYYVDPYEVDLREAMD